MNEESPRVGLALGGGGARGWAHIGAIRALEEAGLRPQVIAGTSMGAAVGAVYAAGKLDDFETWARKLDRSSVFGLFDLSLQGGLIRAGRVFDELKEILPDVDIETLARPFGAVATDLELGTQVRLTSGSLRDAVRASIAIPGLISPWRIGDRWMVDGGVVDPLPVALARSLGASAVIAVELSASKAYNPALAELMKASQANSKAKPPKDTPPEDDGPLPGRDFFEVLSDASERFWAQMNPRDRTPEITPPSVYEVIGQSLQVMQTRLTRSLMAGDPPDLHVVPRLQNVGLMDFDRAEEAIEEGARAVHAALATQARLESSPSTGETG